MPAAPAMWCNVLPSTTEGKADRRRRHMFHVYEVFLIISGIAMLVLASLRTGQSNVRRIWSGVLGAGFLVYGLYLLLFFTGGHYFIFFYVFILPILLIFRYFRDRKAYQARQARQAAATQQPGYGQPG
jgi:predicted lipid-binding transport protein (Tim44 family)